MTNKEKIDEFMSKIDNNWDDLKKLRYICVKLCEIYEYDPKYAYGTDSEKTEYMNNLYAKIFSKTAQERENEIEYENIHKICVDFFEIYLNLVKKAGVSEDKYEVLGNSVVYTDNDGEVYSIYPVNELFSVKTKSSPEGFLATKPLSKLDDNEIMQLILEEKEETKNNDKIFQIDKEIGLINDDGYVGNVDNIVSKRQKFKDVYTLITNIEDALQKGRAYLESVIGTEINNVELHKYYKQVLNTAFPENYCVVKPLANTQLNNIEYVVLVKLDPEKDECVCFLYDKKEKTFSLKSVEEIRNTMKELGVSDLENSSNCFDGKLCDVER